jgi:hypothetical protein
MNCRLNISSILNRFQNKVAFKAFIANLMYTCQRIAFYQVRWTAGYLAAHEGLIGSDNVPGTQWAVLQFAWNIQNQGVQHPFIHNLIWRFKSLYKYQFVLSDQYYSFIPQYNFSGNNVDIKCYLSWYMLLVFQMFYVLCLLNLKGMFCWTKYKKTKLILW